MYEFIIRYNIFWFNTMYIYTCNMLNQTFPVLYKMES